MPGLGALELLHSLPKFVDLGSHRRKRFGQGVVDLLRIGDHDSLTLAKDDVPGDADNRGVIRHVAQHNRTGADAAIPADDDVAENLRASTDDDIVFEGRVALSVLLAGASESYSLIQGDVVSDHGRLANDDAHPVIDEQAAANLCRRMDFNPGEQTRHLRKPARGQEHPVIPEPVIDPVEPDRVQPRVAQKYFHSRLRRGIVLDHVGHVFAD